MHVHIPDYFESLWSLLVPAGVVFDVADGGHGPVAVAAVPLQVDLLRGVGAVLLHRALEAPGRRPLGLLLLPEVVEPPEGLDLGALHVAHPEHDEVDVVAALGQQREAALFLVPPVTPDEDRGCEWTIQLDSTNP